jgi:hypothetical protein
LTSEEALKEPMLFIDYSGMRPEGDDSSEQIECMYLSHATAHRPISEVTKIEVAVRYGKVYAHDPAVHPPTKRGDK